MMAIIHCCPRITASSSHTNGCRLKQKLIRYNDRVTGRRCVGSLPPRVGFLRAHSDGAVAIDDDKATAPNGQGPRSSVQLVLTVAGAALAASTALARPCRAATNAPTAAAVVAPRRAGASANDDKAASSNSRSGWRAAVLRAAARPVKLLDAALFPDDNVLAGISRSHNSPKQADPKAAAAAVTAAAEPHAGNWDLGGAAALARQRAGAAAMAAMATAAAATEALRGAASTAPAAVTEAVAAAAARARAAPLIVAAEMQRAGAALRQAVTAAAATAAAAAGELSPPAVAVVVAAFVAAATAAAAVLLVTLWRGGRRAAVVGRAATAAANVGSHALPPAVFEPCLAESAASDADAASTAAAPPPAPAPCAAELAPALARAALLADSRLAAPDAHAALAALGGGGALLAATSDTGDDGDDNDSGLLLAHTLLALPLAAAKSAKAAPDSDWRRTLAALCCAACDGDGNSGNDAFARLRLLGAVARTVEAEFDRSAKTLFFGGGGSDADAIAARASAASAALAAAAVLGWVSEAGGVAGAAAVGGGMARPPPKPKTRRGRHPAVVPARLAAAAAQLAAAAGAPPAIAEAIAWQGALPDGALGDDSASTAEAAAARRALAAGEMLSSIDAAGELRLGPAATTLEQRLAACAAAELASAECAAVAEERLARINLAANGTPPFNGDECARACGGARAELAEECAGAAKRLLARLEADAERLGLAPASDKEGVSGGARAVAAYIRASAAAARHIDEASARVGCAWTALRDLERVAARVPCAVAGTDDDGSKGAATKMVWTLYEALWVETDRQSGSAGGYHQPPALLQLLLLALWDTAADLPEAARVQANLARAVEATGLLGCQQQRRGVAGSMLARSC